MMKSGDELEVQRKVEAGLNLENMKMLKRFVQAMKNQDVSLRTNGMKWKKTEGICFRFRELILL
ncbi:hypothetical protein [Peribacillus muralis]|uniref:hypothetical protein n=1 Tax=Peribacillus muralis TaxID=264697 RepID=UPI003825ECF8